MALLDSIAVVVHVLFAGLWTGAVAYAAAIAMDADRLGDGGRELVADRLKNISRTSAVAMLLSGGYLAGAYGGGYFMNTTRGLLLSAMVVLWLVLMVTVELGAGRLTKGEGGAKGTLLVAAAVAILLLLDAGVVSVL
ncbi:MAG: hypothetical protein ABEJ67_01785 [Halanaeroarchaeum sp.]